MTHCETQAALDRYQASVDRAAKKEPSLDLYQKCLSVVAERRADETLDDPLKHKLHDILDPEDLMPVFTFIHRAQKGGDAAKCAEVALNKKHDEIRASLIEFYERRSDVMKEAEQMAADIESGYTDLEYERCRDVVMSEAA